MIQFIYLLFFVNIIIIVNGSINIGLINSAAYIPNSLTNTLVYNGTCSECICFAFIFNNSSIYEALNCYMNNNTCLLFTNFSLGSAVKININSKLYFLEFPTTTTTSAVICANVYGTCGGLYWTGPTSCCAGSSCIYNNQYYSQCLPIANQSTTTVSTSNSTTVSYVNVTSQNATAGTYWGCCKTSCSWPNKASVTSPPKTCQQDGITAIDSNTASVCDGGSAYMCINQQPWNVSANLSYGFVGASIIGQSESNWCCACYSLIFTSGPVIGKQMIVQTINTAYSSSNMFILQVPGSGWGSTANGCLSQFNGSYVWGQQYGGVSNRSDCANLPNSLQAGCYWRFDWFMNSNSPLIAFQPVSCPSVLTNITGCIRV